MPSSGRTRPSAWPNGASERGSTRERWCCRACTRSEVWRSSNRSRRTPEPGARLPAARPGCDVDVLPRADRGEMFRWLATLQPSGVALETVLGDLGPTAVRGIQTIVIALPVWGEAGRPPLDGEIRRLVQRGTRVVCVLVSSARAAPDADPLCERPAAPC